MGYGPIMGLWHYTDATGLLGIIGSKTVWASDARYLNDRMELDYGTNALTVALRGVIESAGEVGRYEQMRRFLAELETGSAKTSSIGAALAEKRAFVACFCSSGDILSQWRGYANGSGFSLRFSDAWAHRITGGIKGLGQIACVDVDYSESADAVASFHEMVQTKLSGAHDIPMPKLFGLHARVSQFKHPAFAEERERRLIFRNPKPNSVKVRQAKGRLIPYLAVPFECDDLLAVKIGPGAESESRAVCDALNSFGFNVATVEVTRSEAPFRG